MESVNDHRTSTLRLPAGDRRLQLVETALDFFSRKGFGGTTTKEIAAAAGVTEAIIFRHFPTKQDLYNAVLDHHHDSGKLAECVAQWKSCMERNDDEGLIRAIIERVIEAFRSDLRVLDLLWQYVARRQGEGALCGNDPGPIIAAAYGMAAQYATMTQMFGYRTSIPDSKMTDGFVAIVMHGIQQNQHTQRAQ